MICPSFGNNSLRISLLCVFHFSDKREHGQCLKSAADSARLPSDGAAAVTEQIAIRSDWIDLSAMVGLFETHKHQSQMNHWHSRTQLTVNHSVGRSRIHLIYL